MLKTGEIKRAFQVRIRAFRIWQELGYNPWKRPRAAQKEGGDFYKGAFDGIPFLNDDAKRTFVHLLLRPGYMIRDYVNGMHDRYLAPLTALLIFYAFFSLILAVFQPLEQHLEAETVAGEEATAPAEPEEAEKTAALEDAPTGKGEQAALMIRGVVDIGKLIGKYLHLDEHPELVDTRPKAALAALEGSLRSKGITLFLGDFFLLWLSMGLCLRKYKVRWSASAAAAAYVLCQFCFFMFFAVLLSWGRRTSAGLIVQSLILMVDYKQWLSLSWRKSIGRTVKTGLLYALVWLLFWVFAGILILVVAWAKGVFNIPS